MVACVDEQESQPLLLLLVRSGSAVDVVATVARAWAQARTDPLAD
jgi:hypothetical protein